MKNNTLLYHKKINKKTFHPSHQFSSIKQTLLQNPQNSAKFCLLEISEESQKNNNRTFTYFQNQHSRSNSTQFLNNKQISNINQSSFLFSSNNSLRFNKFEENQASKSVALKSTFSNEMRRTHHSSLERNKNEILNQPSKQKLHLLVQENEQIKKIPKINYIPFAVQEQKQIQHIDQIFKTTPSKQILAILKRVKLAKQLKQMNQKFQYKLQDQYQIRKKSIFNIRPLKQRFEQDVKKQKQSQQKRIQSPDFLMPKQLHMTNNNVVITRLKNRYNKSSLSKR